MSTYTPISSITLASAASSVTFSGIPQTYTDLVLVINSGETVSGDIGYIQFNGDTASNYSSTVLYGDGTSAGSSRLSNSSYIAVLGRFVGMNSSLTDNGIVNIMNYANTTTYKTTISRSNVPSYGTSGDVGLWRNTAAITSILVGVSAGRNWLSGSTFNLYGIANASITNVAKATGGDSVYTDGTYWYHIFRSSGTFTPTQTLSADLLVVAGGGGGGGYGGAGGGGGVSEQSGRSCTASTAYTVTVGAGGARGTSNTTKGTSGGNSVFDTITSNGGGGGGAATNNTGIAGGSGGGGGAGSGAGGAANQGNTGGATGYGFAGGNGLTDSTTYTAGGGGGGAGAVGSNATFKNGGNGGAGRSNSITGSAVTYAGGGGGGLDVSGTAGTGGSGGGGNGALAGTTGSTAGTANTGGGGGGGNGDGQGGAFYGSAGGSGIVIVRYAA